MCICVRIIDTTLVTVSSMDHCNILYIGIQMMMINIGETSGFDLICPAYGHWNFRATRKCPNIQNYTCIYDDNNKNFKETCDGPKTYAKGFKAILRGNIDRQPCSDSRYQPYEFSTVCDSKCVFNHSICSEEGQFTVRNGSIFEDKICGCDYRKGYAFINRLSHLYQCKPSKEDCSCYKKSCPLEKRYLLKDYQCIEETNITVLPDTTPRGTEIVSMETITKENLHNGDHHSVVNGRPNIMIILILTIIVIVVILGFGVYALLTIPLFLNELSDVQCTEGQTAEFKCRVKDKTETLFWSINHHQIMNNPRFEIVNEGCSHKLKISKTSLEDSGQITVRGKNDKCQAQLTVKNLFMEKIKDISCTVGQTAVFKCRVRENVQLTWYYYNTKVIRDERFDFFSEDNVHELKITDVTFEDRGNYSSKANNVECKASLIVEARLLVLVNHSVLQIMAERKRILSSHSKEIVYHVSKFFESEIQQPTATPVKAFTERTAEATLVSEATVRRIRLEKNEKGRIFLPERQKVRGPYKPVDEFDKCAIRQKIHEFYTVRRQLPTIDRLYESL
ncbi:OBSCN [Mytilus coruscus]|uniref:OBSCN n=1 Tax=Mytilus coruscus TaxID=42192 RepID=A0A6J8BT05_MYTCO|nr:OBSCN [Mytilus coruscus]